MKKQLEIELSKIIDDFKEPKIFPLPQPISKILKFELILVFLIKKLLKELI